MVPAYRGFALLLAALVSVSCAARPAPPPVPRPRKVSVVKTPAVKAPAAATPRTVQPPPAPPAAASVPPTAPAGAVVPPLRRVGLLFPSRGRHRGFGVEARRGAEICLEDPDASRSFRIEPVFRDEGDGEDPAAALTALTDLADRQGVVAVIGPLLSGTAEKLLGPAAQRSLALISPTAASGSLGRGSPNFFRTCMTMESFAASLAGFAVTRLDRPTFAILTPGERYGRSFAATFRRVLEEQGGRVSLLSEYEPGLRGDSRWVAAVGKDLRPAAGGGWAVDALFLAGTAQEAGEILQGLAQQGMDPRTIVVVGGSALNVPEFPRLAGGYAEGALAADGFFPGSDMAAARAFTRRYRDRHGADPGPAAAQGCAAAQVLVEALRGGAATPREVLAGLVGLGEVRTAVGALRVFPGGRVDRSPFFMAVSGAALVEIRLP